jgi:hypothetical protein
MMFAKLCASSVGAKRPILLRDISDISVAGALHPLTASLSSHTCAALLVRKT